MGVITCDIRSLALAHRHDPTLSDLLLLHVHTDMMLRCQIFSWLWAGVGWRVGGGLGVIRCVGSYTRTLSYAVGLCPCVLHQT